LTRVRLLTLLACVVAALVSVSAASAAKNGRPAKIQLRQTKLGMILVNRTGFTVYAFTKDSRNHDACQKIRDCTQAWPPVTTAGKPVAGTGVKAALLGTIKLKNGHRQVTYAGHPLYTYVGDTKAGTTSGQALDQFGAEWYVLAPSGHEVDRG
jgi:predicted lipoprotein with Yx(FWY)xxD motif